MRAHQHGSLNEISGRYLIGDAVEFTDSLEGLGIAGIVTSPPYNKAFRNRKPHPSDRWQASRLMAGNYSHYDDDMPEEDYISWQRRFLESSMNAVGDGGVVLYNTGRRIKNLEESRRQEIVEGFPVRQTIIWDRGSSLNQGGAKPSMFPPCYELIYMIAGKNWRLPEDGLAEFRKWGDVWHIPPERGNPHPAPFPLALAMRMVKTVGGHVADPFAGSGTVGIAAMKAGIPFTLNDLSEEYMDMFEKRRNAALSEMQADSLFD